VVITGRDSPAVRRRVADLGLAHAVYGVQDKLAAAEALLRTLGCAWAQAAAIGDDWPDLPVLARAGFACAPANAHVEVRAVAHHVTAAPGRPRCGARVLRPPARGRRALRGPAGRAPRLAGHALSRAAPHPPPHPRRLGPPTPLPT
jgi:hypothetical protein